MSVKSNEKAIEEASRALRRTSAYLAPTRSTSPVYRRTFRASHLQELQPADQQLSSSSSFIIPLGCGFSSNNGFWRALAYCNSPCLSRIRRITAFSSKSRLRPMQSERVGFFFCEEDY
uniref:Uncharacterized protein n=1 Tax=Kalanchoe fedtschenkoi TaxID=63787 RepID=A0A7N0T342_KALFE